MVLEKLEIEHKEMMLCLDITCLCLKNRSGLKMHAGRHIPLLDFCHIRAFFRIVTLDPDKV